ncbi:MAG: SMC-Scp complex subunit ScpB, partial [Clostridia bacterium]|nr:SMC-Scp complex subunit ScpB [Clostridia bacterium]
IRSALELRRNTPLSNAAMEVLAIIAYNEPVTRNLVERVRGVDCSGVMSSLLNKGLIEEKGRLDLPGRPMQYKTTTLFLRCFGMESLAQLPKLPSDTAEEIEGQMTVDDAVESAEEAV